MNTDGNKLPFKTNDGGAESIFIFYEGTEREKFTPYTSKFFNKMSKQLLDNDNNLGNRLTKIEYLITDDSMTINNLNVKKDFTAKNVNITEKLAVEKIESDYLSVKDLKISNKLEVNIGYFSELYAPDAKIKKIDSDIINLKKLVVSDIKIGIGKYYFKDSNIEFNNAGLGIVSKIIDKSSDDVKKTRETGHTEKYFNSDYELMCSSSSKLVISEDKRSYKITFDSNLPGDDLEVISENITLNSKILNLSGKILFNSASSIGSADSPVPSIFAKKFHGSYYTFDEADLAEYYETDKDYNIGDILQVGDMTEGVLAIGTTPILGVVSDKRYIGYSLNTVYKTLKDFCSPIALKGKITVNINGEAKRGQYIIFDKMGKGKAIDKITSFEEQNNLIGVVIMPGKNTCIIKV